ITAQREEETLQRAALPVTVLSADLLRDAGATRPAELSQLAPALQVAGLSGSYAVYYIRGVGNFSGNSLADPAVTFNYDGVSIGRPSSTSGFFFDLERIEILKGPQGTLYGRNATGGAINVLPRRPRLNEWGGELIAEYGDYDWLRVDGALNAPLGPDAALRLAGSRVAHDGYMSDGGDDQDDWSARLSFLVEPTPDLSIALVGDYFSQGGRGPGSTPIALGPDNRFGISSPEAAAFYQGRRHAIAGRNFNPIPATQRMDNEFWGVNATVEWRTPFGDFTFIPAYREGHLDTVGSATGLTLSFIEDDRQASFETRFATHIGERIDLLIGAIVFDEVNEVPLFVPNNQYNMSVQRLITRTDSTAIYGRATFDLSEALQLTLGVRHTEDEKDFEGYFQSFNRLCPPVPTALCPLSPRFPAELVTPPLFIPPGAPGVAPVFNPADGTLTTGVAISADETASFSRTTWRAALEWELSPSSLLYASFETGYKSGGFFFSNDDQTYRPEFVEAFTIGWKNRLFDNRVQLDIEVFHWAYDDQQVSHITLDSLGVTNLRTSNAGEATIQGAEIELSWLAPTGTLLSADVQYLDATYDSFVFLTPISSGPPVSGCDVASSGSSFSVDCGGRRAPYSPEWTVNLGAEHSFALDSGSELTLVARAHYQSETLTGLDFTPLEYQDAYWSVDASLTFTPPDERFSVTLFARNLTDETVVANTFQPPFGNFAVGSLRPPRVIGIRTAARF
ncbi:MAG: TonB-dependent receptor, partial [Hyphomonadaceae bacterium]|nr:TonB-dependent receptor [Hyphomonadaceae bacterium]